MDIDISKTKASDLDEMWGDSWQKTNRIALIKNIHKDENRRWKLKYAPVNGKILEAGCGLGQYVFYFNELGFDCDGIDISEFAIKSNKKFAIKYGYNPEIFKVCDVRKLPYDDNSISYYLSFGVVEHFKEGPMKALEEAFRILKPGGITYIAAPNKYNFNWIFSIHRRLKRNVKKILIKLNLIEIKKSIKSEEWVEHKWTINELKTYVENADFIVIDAFNVGLKSTFTIGMRHHKNLLKKIIPFLYPILDRFEDTFIGKFGVNNIIIAYKPCNEIYCFFCNEKSLEKNRVKIYSIPVCNKCKENIQKKILNNYIKNKNPFFKIKKYKNEVLNKETKCKYCGKSIEIDPLFGDFGFSTNVCKNCIKKPFINLELRNLELKYTEICKIKI